MGGRKAGESRFRIRGELPSPLDPPPGCAFHRRCPYATEICQRVQPESRPVAGRLVECHHAESVGNTPPPVPAA